MGTLKEKLQWFYNLKDSIITMMNNRQTKIGLSTYTTSSTTLESIYNYYNNCQRFKYIPILTDYGIYGPTAYNGTDCKKITPLGISNSDVTSRFENYSNFTKNGYIPLTLSRSDTGKYTGTLSGSLYGGVSSGFNFPFTTGIVVAGSNLWITGVYSSLTYYKPSTQEFEIHTGDDASRNDAYFILGNIKLVDPLTLTDDQAANVPVCLSARVFGSGSYHLNSTYESGYGISGTQSYLNSSGHYYITYSVNNTYYSKIYPVVIPICRAVNDTYSLTYASIKGININSLTTSIEVALSDEGPILEGYFWVYLFAEK